MKLGFEIVNLVTMIPQRMDSWMFHYPNIHMTDLFAEAAGFPLIKSETSGVKDAELADLRRVLSRLSVDAIVSGGISSQYQKGHIDKICQELGLKHIAPLWHEEPLSLLNQIVELKMKTVIVGVYAHGFTPKWLGREIDRAAVNDLVELNTKFQISLVGEGGEYETLVLDAPFFKKRIELIEVEKKWEGESGYLLVKKATLRERQERRRRREEVGC